MKGVKEAAYHALQEMRVGPSESAFRCRF